MDPYYKMLPSVRQSVWPSHSGPKVQNRTEAHGNFEFGRNMLRCTYNQIIHFLHRKVTIWSRTDRLKFRIDADSAAACWSAGVILVANFTYIGVLFDSRIVSVGCCPCRLLFQQTTSYFRLLGLLLTLQASRGLGMACMVLTSCLLTPYWRHASICISVSSSSSSSSQDADSLAQQRNTMLPLLLPSSKHLLFSDDDGVIISHP